MPHSLYCKKKLRINNFLRGLGTDGQYASNADTCLTERAHLELPCLG